MSSGLFTLQQDGAPAHRAWSHVQLLNKQENRRPNTRDLAEISPNLNL